MAPLTSANRARHTLFMGAVLAYLGVTNNSGQTIKLITRLGSRRSLDGVVYDIGNGKVAKVLFVNRGAVQSMQQIEKEYDIQKKMGDAGLGPKTYKLIKFQLPMSLLNMKNKIGSVIPNWPNKKYVGNALVNTAEGIDPRNLPMLHKWRNNLLARPGAQRAMTLNLFQNWYFNNNRAYNSVKNGAVIIMENLYTGPGIKTAMTLEEMAGKKMKIPVDKVAKAVMKMHKLGISHNDLHWGNIMVQIKNDGTERVVVIDFGRAEDPGSKSNQNSNKVRISSVLIYYAGVKNNNMIDAFKIAGVSTVPPAAAPAALSYNLRKAASGGYRIAGMRGPKKVNLTAAQLRMYAANKGVPLNAAKKATKKQLLDMIYAAKGGAKPQTAAASSLGLVMNKGSVRMRGKKGGLVKPTKLTVAQLKAYAAKKGINLTGAKLKKDILQRIAK